jgi:hypothetical protein
LTNIARFAAALSTLDLPDDQRHAIHQALSALRGGDLQGADTAAWTLADLIVARSAIAPGDEEASQTVPHRFAVSVIDFIAAQGDWLAATTAVDSDRSGGVFRPAVPLIGGWLPGAAVVSAQASTTAGVRRGHRIALPAYLRIAVQIGVGATAAIAAGDALSGPRFYWALLAVVVTFMGVSNSGEQARRALFRAAGTAVGIGVGSLAAHLVGHHSNWAIAVILVSIFLGLYLMRINYGLFVIGITVTVAQLYEQLGEFSNHVLVLRLEETAVGAAIAILTVTLVLPLHPRRVIGVAVRAHFGALDTLIGHAADRLTDPATPANLPADVRALDATHQALVATAQPLRRTLFGDVSERLETTLAVAGAVGYHARDLVADLDNWTAPNPDVVAALEEAIATLRASLATLLDALGGQPAGSYTRSAALFDRVERRIETHQDQHPSPAGHRHLPSEVLALHDLILLDGSLARLAAIAGLTVTDLDTTDAQSASTPGSDP